MSNCFSLILSFVLGTGNIQQYLVSVMFLVLYVCVMRVMIERTFRRYIFQF